MDAYLDILEQTLLCVRLRAFGTPPGVVRRLVVCPDTPDMRLPDGIEILS